MAMTAVTVGSLYGGPAAASPRVIPVEEPGAPVLAVPEVPFYSQINDISAADWRKVGCGIASLAMLIEFYEPGEVSVDALLNQGIASGAYLKNAGWTHKSLALLSGKYGLKGTPYDLSPSGMDTAFARLEASLKEGPVIASVYHTFDPKSPIPHLVVINGIEGDLVYYNDPAKDSGGNAITVADFKRGWKKRFIEIRPGA
jgi:ABC-type bacteriocin/lantibiotic exporter with double-glycine peptidase domain